MNYLNFGEQRSKVKVTFTLCSPSSSCDCELSEMSRRIGFSIKDQHQCGLMYVSSKLYFKHLKVNYIWHKHPLRLIHKQTMRLEKYACEQQCRCLLEAHNYNAIILVLAVLVTFAPPREKQKQHSYDLYVSLQFHLASLWQPPTLER